jgi:hypothetical protein
MEAESPDLRFSSLKGQTIKFPSWEGLGVGFKNDNRQQDKDKSRLS